MYKRSLFLPPETHPRMGHFHWSTAALDHRTELIFNDNQWGQVMYNAKYAQRWRTVLPWPIQLIERLILGVKRPRKDGSCIRRLYSIYGN